VPQARNGDGEIIPPGSGVVPVVQEVGDLQLRVIGTAFYLTRYGLFATARHVLEALVDWDIRELAPRSYILQHSDTGEMIIRPITSVSLSNTADVAIGQVATVDAEGRPAGHGNLRPRLCFESPSIGERLVTFAYPDNKILDFRDAESPAELHCDYFEGEFLEHISSGERPFIPQHHFQTSLEIRSGSSGCPVFNSQGQIVAIASRGWDFRGSEHEGHNLSSVLPVSLLLPIEIECARVPSHSWEFSQIPVSRRSGLLTLAELVAYGHVDVGTFGPRPAT
jgi:hypothetical protein